MRDASFPQPLMTRAGSEKSPLQAATDINFWNETYSPNTPVLPRAALWGPAAQGLGSPIFGSVYSVQSI